jgi:hypothetical protein
LEVLRNELESSAQQLRKFQTRASLTNGAKDRGLKMQQLVQFFWKPSACKLDHPNIYDALKDCLVSKK